MYNTCIFDLKHSLPIVQPGHLLNHRYRIERKLAAGAFGQTFIAVDTQLPSQSQVVVKLLKPQSNDPATLQIAKRLFKQEAENLERLGRDNDRIPSLYAYFESCGEFYLVQEFIEGGMLAEELDGTQLSESATLSILQEILTGLTKVHSQKLIHRDLKPGNIIRRQQDGKLVLIDFGAVKQVRTATTKTPTAATSQTIGIGTPGYMPTEQLMGYPKLASDIYAVGAIGIQCLTGSAPDLLFNEDTLKLEWQHLCSVSSDFARVLDRMVAEKFQDRYAHATKALEAIESLLSPAPPPISPSTPSPTLVPPPTPNPPTIQTTLNLPTTQISITPPTQTFPPPPTASGGKTGWMSIDRRNFLKWLGFGGVGVVSVLALRQIGENSLPKLAKIQFTSVKLNNKGEIVDRPARSAEIFTEDLGNGIKLTMVKIPAGKFLMGQTPAEKQELIRLNSEEQYRNWFANELPQYQVNVPEFYLGQTLVTQAQYQAIMDKNPSKFAGNDKLPVEQVNWLEAMDFCQKLSKKTGRTYRLPSEAEWEYACRAGTTTPFAFGETINPKVVNYQGSYPYGGAAKGENWHKTTPVGTFPPNLFGVYDMHGNVWEWCLDEWFDNYNRAPNNGGARGDINSKNKDKLRPLRGGSWKNSALNCRSANRYSTKSSSPNYLAFIGFRVRLQLKY